MNVSFTGSESGMTAEQKPRVRKLLSLYKPDLVIHGDCIGADEDFHVIALEIGVRCFRIRPGHDSHGQSPKRAHCADKYKRPGCECLVFPSEPYLKRNDKIAADGQLLLATPDGFEEVIIGSGTWATVRYAYKRSRSIEIIYPNGSLGTYPPRSKS